MYHEVNFDGLVGPTHNHAGLSFGNVASLDHKGQTSSPRQAALQGLEKMGYLMNLGLKQAILPPHDRPHLPTLHRLGFSGNSDAAIVEQVAHTSPELLATCSSASAMWTANAATVSPSPDCQDGRTHFTPANLHSMFHRSLEPGFTGSLLKRIFSGDNYHHHAPLPAHSVFADEGAANHTRLSANYGDPGVALFAYGSETSADGSRTRFPARQTLRASQAIARQHGLQSVRCVFAQQHPEAIDAGVFHNDVIAVGNRNLMFFHEKAFVDKNVVINTLQQALGDTELNCIEVPEARVGLNDAVQSYLFNSQLISAPGKQGHSLVLPRECTSNVRVREYLDSLCAENPAIADLHFMELRQSMHNGGGPACLRLRVVLSESQLESLGAGVLLDASLLLKLKDWVCRHYRDELHPDDLGDPHLLQESRQALDELTGLLKLGSVYDFQQR